MSIINEYLTYLNDNVGTVTKTILKKVKRPKTIPFGGGTSKLKDLEKTKRKAEILRKNANKMKDQAKSMRVMHKASKMSDRQRRIANALSDVDLKKLGQK